MMMANSCLDPEDAAAPFDALLTKIEDINLKIKEVNGDSWWTSTTVTRAHSAQAGDKSQICKFGMNCNKRQSGECKRIHTSGKGKGKGGSNNSQPTKPDSKTRCANMPSRAAKKTNHKKVIFAVLVSIKPKLTADTKTSTVNALSLKP